MTKMHLRITECVHGNDKGKLSYKLYSSEQSALDSIDKNGPDNCYWRRTYVHELEVQSDK